MAAAMTLDWTQWFVTAKASAIADSETQEPEVM
jgi:hypothetical protein